MAQQLAAEGEEMGLVALVDEPAPLSGYRPSPLEMARFLSTGIARSIWPYLHDYFYLVNAAQRRDVPARKGLEPPLKMLESFLARSALANFVPRDSRVLALRQPAMVPMFQLFRIHLRETLAYVPRAYPHGLTLFTTDEVRDSRGRQEPAMGWDKLAAGGVEIHEVPGRHLSLLKPPNVKVFASLLADCLARARASQRAAGIRPRGVKSA
jgi:thioesterase domain-containing protein